MRVLSSIESGGTQYDAIWATLSWIDPATYPTSGGLAIVVRDETGKNETIIRRNAKLADVQASLRQLRALGMNDARLSQLFNHRGAASGLAQHIKELVANLR